MAKAKISNDDYIDPTYKSWICSKGAKRKLIVILREITKQPSTIDLLHEKTKIAVSDLRKLVKLAEEEGYIKRTITPKMKSRGRPKAGFIQEQNGRPEHVFSITGKGRWLMRLDPELRDKWDKIKLKYPTKVAETVFDSYANFKCGIKKSQNLKRFEKFEKDYQLVNHYLEMLALRPFLFTYDNQEADAINCYDELVSVIANYVLPEHRVGFYQALEESLAKLQKEIKSHAMLMSKMSNIPEVNDYLIKQKT